MLRFILFGALLGLAMLPSSQQMDLEEAAETVKKCLEPEGGKELYGQLKKWKVHKASIYNALQALKELTLFIHRIHEKGSPTDIVTAVANLTEKGWYPNRKGDKQKWRACLQDIIAVAQFDNDFCENNMSIQINELTRHDLAPNPRKWKKLIQSLMQIAFRCYESHKNGIEAKIANLKGKQWGELRSIVDGLLFLYKLYIKGEEKQTQAPLIVFRSFLNRTVTLTGRQVIKFDLVPLNNGQRYDPNTGKFNAKCHGLYQFSVKVVSQTSVGHVFLKQNGEIVDFSFSGHSQKWNQASMTNYLMLKENDEVWVEGERQISKLWTEHYHSAFSGCLVRCLP